MEEQEPLAQNELGERFSKKRIALEIHRYIYDADFYEIVEIYNRIFGTGFEEIE